MTVSPYGQYANVGLEDVTQADLVLPRVGIDHKKNKFVHSVTKEEYDSVEGILLAQIKQRIMWPPEVDESDNAAPQCKSTDFVHGFPNVDPKAAFDKLFPWAESSFQPEAGAAGAYEPEILQETGLPALTCEKCIFKDWINNKTRCKEQHTFPFLMNDAGSWSPAILTLQGSGIAPSKTYISSFATSGVPLFTITTILTLTQRRRGTVDYSVPVLRRGTATDPTMIDEYVTYARSMRDTLRRPPLKRDDPALNAAPIQNQNAAPQVIAQQPVVQAPPVQQAPPVVQQAPPQPVQPVVQQAPPQPVQPVQQVAPPQQPAPIQQPPAQVAPPVVQQPVQVAPPQQPVQVAPPAPVATQPQAAAVVEDIDALPF